MERDDRHPLPRASLAAEAGHPILTPPDLGLKKSLGFKIFLIFISEEMLFEAKRFLYSLASQARVTDAPCSASGTSAPGSGDGRDFLPRVFEVLKLKERKQSECVVVRLRLSSPSPAYRQAGARLIYR